MRGGIQGVMQNCYDDIRARALSSREIEKHDHFFALCFRAFKNELKKDEITLTSKDFPGGGEQNQKKLARKILDAVSGLNVDTYIANLIRPDSFEVFLDNCGELNFHEIYDLAQALKGHTESLVFFKTEQNDNGMLDIIYPYYDASIRLTKEQAEDSLRYLETKFMDGLDADTWYGFMLAMDKND